MICDKDAALELLQTAGCSENVIQHCLVVSELAREIADKIKLNGYPVDVELVYMGALLHDIGRSRTHSINHGIEGAQLAEEHGLDEKLIRIIITHIGAGITIEEAKYLGFPPGNYIPATLEEKIVSHADNLVIDNTIVPISELVETLQNKGRHGNIIKRITDLNDEIGTLIH